METASDSLHDFRAWKKVVKNLAAYDFKLLYKYIFMIKWTGFEFKNFKSQQE
jgi:hypothetical protein